MNPISEESVNQATATEPTRRDGSTSTPLLAIRGLFGGILMGLANLVPGIIVSNLELIVDDPALSDLGPSILHLFGVGKPETMLGRNIFGEKVPLHGR